MANQSAKKNEQAIKGKVKFMNFFMYPLFAIFLIVNMFFAIGESISFWHLLWCVLVSAASFFCIKQTVKCWELNLPAEASQYYIDILALNTIVAVIDPFTHKIWQIILQLRHLYWLFVLFAVVKLGGFLWDYITPKYQQETEEKDGKKQKKQKKERVKYMKA